MCYINRDPEGVPYLFMAAPLSISDPMFWLPVENADSCIEEAVAPKASPNTL